MATRNKTMRYFTESASYTSLEDGKRPTRLQWRTIIHDNWPIPAFMLLGTLMCLGVIGHTAWLAKQNLTCPDWASNCTVHNLANWTWNNLAMAQGLATIFYAAGLMCMAYAVQHIAETAIWPLHSRKPLSLDQIDTYLIIVRGAIPPHKALFEMLKSLHAGIFITATIIATLLPLAAAPILGAAWARRNFPTEFQSNYQIGGGIGRMFAQTNPPVSVGAESLSAFIAWSRNLAIEPMPEARHYIIDRPALKDIGNFTARAVRSKNNITCYPWNVTELQSPARDTALYSTSMATRNSNFRIMNSTDSAAVRLAETLAVWADDFEFIHANRSKTRLVLAAFNGSIESGIISQVSQAAAEYPTTVSTIACDVDVELVDDIVKIGNGGPPNTPLVTISSIAGMHISFKNSTTNGGVDTLNENALWFAAAPLIVCPNVDGKQPMYYRDPDSHANSSLPTGYTKAPFQTDEGGQSLNDWTINEIIHFINVTIGATALASAQNFKADHPVPAKITSLQYSRRINERSALCLALPVIVLFLADAVLLYRNVVLHHQQGLSVMRMATMRDILDNVRPKAMAEIARAESNATSYRANISRASSIKGVHVKVDRVSQESDYNHEPDRDIDFMLRRSRDDLDQAMESTREQPHTEHIELERRDEDADADRALLSPPLSEHPASPGMVPERFSSLHPQAAPERFHSLHSVHNPRHDSA